MATPLVGSALEEARSLLRRAGIADPEALDCLLTLLTLRDVEQERPRLADPATWALPGAPGAKAAVEAGLVLFSRIADAPREGCCLRVRDALAALRYHRDTQAYAPLCEKPAERFPLADDAAAHELVRLVRDNPAFDVNAGPCVRTFAAVVRRYFVGNAYGAYFTPQPVVDYLVARAADGRDLGRVFDPACGAGGFLVAARYAGATAAFGTEVSPWAHRLGLFNALVSGAVQQHGAQWITRGDFLRGPVVGAPFDTILCAPPSGLNRVDYCELVAINGPNGVEGCSAFPMSGGGSRGCGDCYYLQRIVRSLAVGGRACVVLPLGKMLTGWEGNAELFRRALLSAVALRELTVIPPEVDENSSIPMVALIFDKVCELGDCVEQAGLAMRAGVQPATREFRIRQMTSAAPGEAPNEAPPGRVVTLEELEANRWRLVPSDYS